MKRKSIVFFVSIAAAFIFAGCGIVNLEGKGQSERIRIDDAINKNMPFSGSNFIYATGADVPEGTYLLQNLWKDRYISYDAPSADTGYTHISCRSLNVNCYWSVIYLGNYKFNLLNTLTGRYLCINYWQNYGQSAGSDITSGSSNRDSIKVLPTTGGTSYNAYTHTFYLVRNTDKYNMNGCWAIVPVFTDQVADTVGVLNYEKGGYAGTRQLSYSFQAKNFDNNWYTDDSLSGKWNWDWWSKDWYFIPVSSTVIDNFNNNTSNNVGGGRYIYQCAGSTASPNDPYKLQHNPSADWLGAVDDDGYCGYLSYRNVTNGIAGFGTVLSSDGSSVNISEATGIRLWISSPDGLFPSDKGIYPLLQVQINSSRIGDSGWLGNYWHKSFYLTHEWFQFEIPFSDFKAPATSTVSLRDCLKEAVSIEFQQSNVDNARGYKNTCKYYIDGIELYY